MISDNDRYEFTAEYVKLKTFELVGMLWKWKLKSKSWKKLKEQLTWLYEKKIVNNCTQWKLWDQKVLQFVAAYLAQIEL